MGIYNNIITLGAYGSNVIKRNRFPDTINSGEDSISINNNKVDVIHDHNLKRLSNSAIITRITCLGNSYVSGLYLEYSDGNAVVALPYSLSAFGNAVIQNYYRFIFSTIGNVIVLPNFKPVITGSYNYNTENQAEETYIEDLKLEKTIVPASTNSYIDDDTVDLTDSIRSFYSLNDNMVDSVLGNNMVLGTGTETYNAGGPRSFQFNGSTYITGDEIKVPLKSWSISLWLYPQSNGRVVTLGTNLPCVQLYSGRFYLCHNGTWDWQPGNNDPSWLEKQWQHVVYTYDGITFRFYLNGFLRVSLNKNFNSFSYTNNGKSRMGYGINFNEAFTGNVTNVGIWDRPLNRKEVITLYNNGDYFNYPFIPNSNSILSNIKGYWPMVNDTNDITGRGNNLTLGSNASLVSEGPTGGSYLGTSNTGSYANCPYDFKDGELIQECTMSAWIKLPEAYNGNILASCGDKLNFFVVQDGSKAYIYTSTVNSDLNSGVEVPINEWVFLTVTVSPFRITRLDNFSGAYYTFYVNGEYRARFIRKNNLPVTPNFSRFSIGNNANQGATSTFFSFKGNISEVGIWSRVLLDSEIKFLYNKTKDGISYPFT